MPYQIPQKLQYEEKIIFGLTLKQMLYALVFVLPALLIFMKTSMNIYAKGILSTILIGAGLMFMFFNLQSHIMNFFSWYKFRKAELMDNKMKEFLGIKEIKNDTLYIQEK